MATIFFLKNSGAEPTAKNSIILRYKLAETNKYKVKGLGISCTKSDWNQSEQKLLKSNSHQKRNNAQLEFIEKEIEKIEKEKVVRSEDIDTIVEASIKGLTLEVMKNKGSLLTEMLDQLYEVRQGSKKISKHTQRKLITVKNSLLEFETKVKYKISADMLNKSSLPVQNDFVEYFRNLGNKDSSIKHYLAVLNTAINYYSKFSGNKVKIFQKSDTIWEEIEKPMVALNKSELEKLYKFVFGPKPDKKEIKTNPSELRNMKYFLFRCFCGMRVGDMTKSNINKAKLKKDSETFTYFQDKGTKKATVYCIGNYLYDIAESLNWDFPDFSANTGLFTYSTNETKAVRKHLKYLFKDEPRKIEHTTVNGFHYTNLSDEVTTHTARKTFAHLLYDLTKDIMLVKHHLGHATIETTMNYLGFTMDKNSSTLKQVNLGF